jgi:hypothetical protein
MPGALSPVTARNDDPRSKELATELPRDFHFAVTWVTLFAHLDPIEAAGPWRPAVVQSRENPSTALALVPVVAPPPQQEVFHAAWEMVVPKMVRTGAGDFAPANSGEHKLL